MALLALLLACGLRRHEAVSLQLDQREDHWAIVDLSGKGGYIRTVPIPDWGIAKLNGWLSGATHMREVVPGFGGELEQIHIRTYAKNAAFALIRAQGAHDYEAEEHNLPLFRQGRT